MPFSPADLRRPFVRVQVIALMLEFRRLRSRSASVELHADGFVFRSMNEVAAHVALENGICERTVWRWYSRYERRGYDALAQPARADKGSSRFFVNHPSAARFVVRKLARDMAAPTIRRAMQVANFPIVPACSTIRAYARSLRGGSKQ